jgi:FKBP-type peptidyl-prolyl cis-trans isomerase 2
MAIKKGDKIKIDYVGTLEDGTEFDNSKKHGKPLEFEVGSGQVIPGLDKAMISLEKDADKEITIKPEEAYGPYNDELIKKIEKKALPQDQEPKAGMTIMIGTPEGQQFPARITEVTDNDITIDINHPLAGKTLKFKINVVAIN